MDLLTEFSNAQVKTSCAELAISLIKNANLDSAKKRFIARTFSRLLLLAARLGGLSTDAEQVSNARSIMDFQQYILAIIEDCRANPQDDMISDLSTAEIDDGRRLSDEEVLSLIQNHDQMQTLRGDPETISNALEEILRMETPSAGLWRVVKKDTEFNGVKIPKDAMVLRGLQ